MLLSSFRFKWLVIKLSVFYYYLVNKKRGNLQYVFYFEQYYVKQVNQISSLFGRYNFSK
ncbi:hypothetical protein FM106_22700 [Brachybacterium faecium]|nr:hypothetical protein FM106_22700 [Brachybacterium faecium]